MRFLTLFLSLDSTTILACFTLIFKSNKKKKKKPTAALSLSLSVVLVVGLLGFFGTLSTIPSLVFFFQEPFRFEGFRSEALLVKGLGFYVYLVNEFFRPF